MTWNSGSNEVNVDCECLLTGPARWQSRKTTEEEGLCPVSATSGHGRRCARVGLPVRLHRRPLHQWRWRRGGHASSHGHRGRALAWSRLPVARQPLIPVTEAAFLRSERLLNLGGRQRGVDPNVKSAGNTQRLQLPAATPHHQEVVSRWGYQAFVRPSNGCANAEAPVVGPYPADACRPPNAPCGVGAAPTSWTPGPTWQPPGRQAIPPKLTSPASHRLPRM